MLGGKTNSQVAITDLGSRRGDFYNNSPHFLRIIAVKYISEQRYAALELYSSASS
jgi:hypothetical protein